MNEEQIVRSADRSVQVPGMLLANGGVAILLALGLILTTSDAKLSILPMIGAVIVTTVAAAFVLIGWTGIRSSKN